MTATRVALGSINHAARAASVTLTSGTSNATFGLSYLYDGLVGIPWIAGAAAGAFVFKYDLDLLGAYGGFEATFVGGLPVGFTTLCTGTGTLTRDTGTVYTDGGAASCKLTPNGGGNVAGAYRDLTVRSGGKHTVKVALYGAASGTINVYLRNQTTGYYLTSGGAWQKASTAFATKSSTGWALTTVDFTVEAATITEADLCTLRLSFSSSGTVVSYIDALTIYPAVDVCSFHGHTITQERFDVAVDSSDDASSWTSRLTPTPAQPAFYGALASATRARYWRVTLTDNVASDTPSVSEIVLTETLSLDKRPAYGLATTEMQPQTRSSTPAGSAWRAAATPRPVRSLSMSFLHASLSSYQTLLAELRRARHGVDLALVIPDDGESVVMLGVAGQAVTTTRETPTAQATSEWAVAELPGPEVSTL